MNTYLVQVKPDREAAAREFFCDADVPGDAIAAVLRELPPMPDVLVGCHFYASDVSGRPRRIHIHAYTAWVRAA